jgi:hypothetical protein
MITIDEAKNLRVGDILYHTENKNKDGSPQRWRVNGVPKTWKRSPEKVRVPMKHGLYDFDYLTETDLSLVSRSEEFFIRKFKEVLRKSEMQKM